MRLWGRYIPRSDLAIAVDAGSQHAFARQILAQLSTVTSVTNFCFTYLNWDGLYSPPLNSRKIGKWLKTLGKRGFSKVFENGEKLSPPLRQNSFSQ